MHRLVQSKDVTRSVSFEVAKKSTIEAMDTNYEINLWAIAAVAALLEHCIEQAQEAQAFIDLMCGDFE